jgi:DNA-binding beta-propeller fold protein YncE
LTKDGESLLVASFSEGFVGRVDPGEGTIIDRVDVGGSATAVVARGNDIYAAVFETGEVVRIDSATFEVVDRLIVGAGPVGLQLGSEGRVWVANRNEGTVARVDFETGEIISIPVGDGPVEVAAAFGSIWVAVADAGELVQISIADRAVVTRTPLGGAPTGLSVGAGSLWVAVSGDRSVVRVTL